MTARFVIRKDSADPNNPWALRDKMCPRWRTHDHYVTGWGKGKKCRGACNAFATHPEAIDGMIWSS